MGHAVCFFCEHVHVSGRFRLAMPDKQLVWCFFYMVLNVLFFICLDHFTLGNVCHVDACSVLFCFLCQLNGVTAPCGVGVRYAQ